MTKNFTRAEFACKCGCGWDRVSPLLVERLQTLREAVALPIIINSACRCETHNRVIGGERESYHLLGMAADIRIVSMPASRVADVAAASGLFKGIGRYNTFTHLDVRRVAASWTG